MRPAQAFHSLERLFDALAQALPITFVDAGRVDPASLDGMLVLDPARVADAPAHLPTLVAGSMQQHPTAHALIRFTGDELLHRALRGRRLTEQGTSRGEALQCEERDRVLATAGSRPVWWRKQGAQGAQVSAFAVHELQAGETLRDHLRPGRFMGLVPLLHFLRAVADGGERPLQAAFVIDDPNLHWTSYGYLKYPELVDHARRHGYHIALATVPLDGWCVNRRAAELIGGHGAQVSLLVHGNDHVGRELGRLASDGAAELAVAQALRRVATLERRACVDVSRVMAPPHGACSEAVLRAMFRLGFEAACISNPYPWRAGLRPPTPLAGWHPAEMVAGGLPVLPRHHLDHPREELVFRAFLGQPLILYGHHWDMADGLDVLGQAAADVNSLGDVRWRALDQIARANFTYARERDVLVLRIFSRAAQVDVPEGVTAVRVETADVHGGPLWRGVACGELRAPLVRSSGGWTSPELPVAGPVGGRRTVQVTLEPARPLNPWALARPVTRPWPLTRRVLVEGRDRLRPLISSRRRAALNL